MKKRKNGRRKGAEAELELAHYLSDRGFKARRGQQFSGGGESPDVVCLGLGDFHIECKRVEGYTTELYKWVAQSKRDAGKSKKPLVIHRKNQQEWIVICRLDDFLEKIIQVGL